MRFAILGPGGVGGFLAAVLARAGEEVEVLAGEETARAIAARGISLESPKFGAFTVQVETSTHLSKPADAVLVTVKATQLREALERVPAERLAGGLVVPFLNGIEHVERLRTVYPPRTVVPGTIRIETIRVEPGVIRHTSPFALVALAAGGEAVAERMRAAGLEVTVRDDETSMLWDKMALLAPMALLTTHARAGVGAIRTKRREELVALLEEITELARADGVTLEAAALLRFIDSAPETMGTSMERDQAAGLPLELDALGGALLRRASRAGVEVPVTRRLVEEIAARTPASTSA